MDKDYEVSAGGMVMRRRAYLTAAAITGIAGCLGGFGRQEPRFKGPTEEDPDDVDIRYREFTDDEIRTIRADAQEIPYDELVDNIDDYVGDPVVFSGNLIEIDDHGDHFVYRISAAGDPTQIQWIYASWTGDPFEEASAVTCWGEILGIERFMQAMGEDMTVPAIAIAYMELSEE